MFGSPGGGQEGGQPVQVADDLVGHGAGLDLAGPAHHGRHPEGALPVGVLLVAEGRHAAVGPGVHMRPVVGAVHDDGVVGDAQVIQLLQQGAHALVMVDHDVVVFRLPAAGLAQALGLGMGAEVHVRGVEPHEETAYRPWPGGRCIPWPRPGPHRRWSPSAFWSAGRCLRCGRRRNSGARPGVRSFSLKLGKSASGG